ncbi:hypothetical protein H2200_010836 [Cladophialophora chaetospira]|uniref:NAD(P)-binding protein n=1 Tax=Cladophialophora chaetospira TaxID=386627 RepID=A0AA38X0U7_9EURO|nr:hypothetical protein H2200_010836 [Cladophialophora chaetospira]
MTTTYDFVAAKLADPAGAQAFFGGNPDAWIDSHHFPGVRDTHEAYPFIDPTQNKALSQEDKVVLVAGASKGIGRAIALAFAKAHPKALILWARNLGQLEELQKEIKITCPATEVLVQRVDVTSEGDVTSALKKVKENFGAIDIAINNAGNNACKTNLGDKDSDLQTWWSHFDLHVKGLFLLARGFLQLLADADKSSGATLINITSSASIGVIPTQSAYSASKHAADRVIETLTLEYPTHTFYSLHPGVVDTDITRAHNVSQFGWNFDAPDLSAGVALWLTTPDATFLKGRWISANWRVDDLLAKRDEIEGRGLLKGGINARLGVEK